MFFEYSKYESLIFKSSITIEIKPLPIYQGKNLALYIKNNNSTAHDSFDFSNFNQNFIILSTGKRSSVSIINGNMITKTDWIINLLPKKIGKFIIPALQFGQEKSPSRIIYVLALPAADLTDTQSTTEQT